MTQIWNEGNIMFFEESKLLRGKPYQINKIQIRNPSLNDILELGELKYNDYLFFLASTPEQCKVMLFDNNIDYEELSNYDLFIRLLIQDDNGMSRVSDLGQEALNWWLCDTFEFQILFNQESQMPILIDVNKDIVIDMYLYDQMAMFAKIINNIPLQNKYNPADKGVKLKLIKEEKKSIERQLKKKTSKKNFIQESMLNDIVVSLVTSEYLSYTYENIWDITIYQANESIKKISQRDNYKANIIGIYTGNVEAKKVSADLNWMSNIRKIDMTSTNVIDLSKR